VSKTFGRDINGIVEDFRDFLRLIRQKLNGIRQIVNVGKHEHTFNKHEKKEMF
jgi:hypothetical protein